MASWEKVFVTDPRFVSDFLGAEMDDRGINQILGTDKKWDSSLRIRKLDGGINSKVMLIGLVAILAVGGFFGWKFYADGVAAKEMEETTQRDNALQDAKRMSDIQNMPRLSWMSGRSSQAGPNEPSTGGVVSMCQAAFARVPTNTPGGS